MNAACHCNGRPGKPFTPAMSKTRRYMIEVTDMKTGDVVVFTGADWTLEERGFAVAQICVWPGRQTTTRRQPKNLVGVVAKPDAQGRRFCHALAEETAGMAPGSWRMVHTIAQRMGITFEEASAVADDCVRHEWADHRQHTVSLREEGRLVAAAVRKAIVTKPQPAARARATRKDAGRKIVK